MVSVASICVRWSDLCFHILGQSNADDVELTLHLGHLCGKRLWWWPAWRNTIWESVRIAAYLPAYCSLPNPHVSPSCYPLECNVMYHIASKSEISKLLPERIKLYNSPWASMHFPSYFYQIVRSMFCELHWNNVIAQLYVNELCIKMLWIW